ncbi:MAG: hypothetical protein JW804_08500 [Sedimentisphaerales bacterium]|nr:hypothetical protein [Sedimentisphaerales bacterium]
MKEKCGIKYLFLLVVISIVCCAVAGCNSDKNITPEVSIRRVEYHGWEDSIEITNDKVRVVVVPVIGRIMYYGYIGGENLLYEDAEFYGRTLSEGKPLEENGQAIWATFGGDRIWPSEESMFVEINGHKRPPDHWLDGMAWDANIVDDTVIITSEVSEYCGAQVSREIRLIPNSTRLNIHQVMKKIKPAQKKQLEPLPLTIWNITKVEPPSVTMVLLNRDSCFDGRVFVPVWDDYDNQGYKNIEIDGDVGFFVPDAQRNQKMGADAPKWVAAIIGQTVIAEFFSYQADATYPDGGTSTTIFSCPEFTELECMSPLAKLKPGQSMEYEICWELFELESDVNHPDEQRKEAVKLVRGKN